MTVFSNLSGHDLNFNWGVQPYHITKDEVIELPAVIAQWISSEVAKEKCGEAGQMGNEPLRQEWIAKMITGDNIVPQSIIKVEKKIENVLTKKEEKKTK